MEAIKDILEYPDAYKPSTSDVQTYGANSAVMTAERAFNFMTRLERGAVQRLNFAATQAGRQQMAAKGTEEDADYEEGRTPPGA